MWQGNASFCAVRFWRLEPCACAVLLSHLRWRADKQHAIKTGLGEGDLNNATWVPANQFGRVVADPHAEVGEHIKGKANRNSMGIENGELNNATWVPANQYGRVVADPHAEVGEHIDGKRVSVTADLLTGEIHNARCVTVSRITCTHTPHVSCSASLDETAWHHTRL